MKYWCKVLVSDYCIIECYIKMYTHCESFGYYTCALEIKTLLSNLRFFEIWCKREIEKTLFWQLWKKEYNFMIECSYVESLIIQNSDTCLTNVLPLFSMVKMVERFCSIQSN